MAWQYGTDPLEYKVVCHNANMGVFETMTNTVSCRTNRDLYQLLRRNNCFHARDEINVLFDRVRTKNVPEDDEEVQMSRDKEVNVEVLITFGSLGHSRMGDIDRLQRERYVELQRLYKDNK